MLSLFPGHLVQLNFDVIAFGSAFGLETLFPKVFLPWDLCASVLNVQDYPRTGDLRESLKYIYNLYVQYVVKNPLYTSGTPIR
ncbi:hypothetical protein L3X38_027776 [Prunus dulcis]|uniref:Uncharacterized protein n=1 Tax=Prunus dulcis TaxID=3755 RepID=A0AAD4VNL9_PRUDU|nr:hypothetical protein L3X38_027776 [Prunus dulcis]